MSAKQQMLCEKCKAIPSFKLRQTVPHHITFAALDKSSKDGCNLCTVFKMTTLDYYAESFSCTREKAEEYHLAIDELVSTAQNSRNERLLHKNYQEENQEGKGSGNEDNEDNEDYEDDDYEYYVINGQKEKRGIWPSSFFVRAGIVEIDSNFVSLSQGLHSLEYVRLDDACFDPLPVGQVYPAVHVDCLEESVPLLKWNVIGRPVPVMADYSLAKSWIYDCLVNHTKCSPNDQLQLPARILDLWRSRTDKNIWLDVKLTGHERYATLSHCWGSSKPLQLTLANYDQLQTMIIYNSLPKNFQDAIAVTRALGLRYLWIDSLCIIQDSQDDWEQQCTEMAQIYGGSIVTIAGPAAPNSESGFISPRKPMGQATIEITDGEELGAVTIAHWGMFQQPYQFISEPNSPLAQRGWVLQERLLSQRILYFGSSNMYFECFTNIRFGSCHYPIHGNFEKTHIVTKRLIKQLENAEKRFQYWFDIVEMYGDTLLTKSIDRLPALSALASEFCQAKHCRYLAGIWKEDLIRMLIWYIPYQNRDKLPPKPNIEEYVAPSWSWASAKHSFKFIGLDTGYHILHVDMKIIEAEAKPSGIDPFGTVREGYLRIHGRRRRAEINLRPDPLEPGKQNLCIYSKSPASELFGEYHPDDGSTVPLAGTRIVLLYLG